jgi:hypothetical protein
MALFLEVEPCDELRIGRSTVRIERKSGQKARLRIDSPDDVHHVKPGEEPPAPAETAPPPASPEPPTASAPFTRAARP